MGDWRDACRSPVCRSESTDKAADRDLSFDRPDLVRADHLIDTRWHSIEAALQRLSALLAAKP